MKKRDVIQRDSQCEYLNKCQEEINYSTDNIQLLISGIWKGKGYQKLIAGDLIQLPDGEVILLEIEQKIEFTLTANITINEMEVLNGTLLIEFDYKNLGFDIIEHQEGELLGILYNDSILEIEFNNNNNRIDEASLTLSFIRSDNVLEGSYEIYGFCRQSILYGSLSLEKMRDGDIRAKEITTGKTVGNSQSGQCNLPQNLSQKDTRLTRERAEFIIVNHDSPEVKRILIDRFRYNRTNREIALYRGWTTKKVSMMFLQAQECCVSR